MCAVRVANTSVYAIRPKDLASKYGLATSPPQDAFVGRKDVVGFIKRRRTFVPFLRKHEIIHPTERVQGGDQNVIILDIDELGTTGSNTTTTDNGAHASSGVHVGSAMFLSIVGVLAFYGTYASVNELIASTQELKELKEEKKTLLAHRQAIFAGLQSRAGKQAALRPNTTLLQENHHMRSKAHVDRVFMGAFGGLGATTVGASILANAQMFGALSSALAAAASPIMFAATPLVTIFGTGVAAYEVYRVARTFRIARRLPGALRQRSLGNEDLAERLLRRRLKTIRYVSGLKGASYLGLAIGVPMTVFGGPYGLPLLLASAGGMVLAGVLEGALTGYAPQLTLEDKMLLCDTHDYTNAIEDTHAKRVLLNQLRKDKRRLYPHGGNAFFPVGALVRGVAATRRVMSRQAKHYPSPEHRVLEFMHDFSALDEAYAARDFQAADHRAWKVAKSHAADAHLRVMELTQATQEAAENYAQMRLEHRLHPFDAEPVVAPEEAVFALMQFFVRAEFLRSFGLELVNSRKLRTAFAEHDIITRHGREWHFDANKLVLLFTQTPCEESGTMLHQAFQIAEKALATTERKRMRSKERQLLDLFSEHITPKKRDKHRLKAPISG